MFMKNYTLSLLMVFIALTLSACEKTKEQFDFSKKPPDEFAVTTRAPLEMPTDLNTLPAPRPGAPRPQENSPTEEAKEVLFGNSGIPLNQSGTQGEQILLQKTGAANANPAIRDTVDRETAEKVKKETPTIDRILGKAGKKINAPATVVDPVKESERIKQNKEAGKSVTDGETPTIEK